MLTRFKESPEPHGLPDCFDDKIMHATVRIGKTTLMASDGQCEGKQDFEGFTSRLRCLTRPRPSVSLLRWVKAAWLPCRWRRRSGRQNSACYRTDSASPGWFRSNTSPVRACSTRAWLTSFRERCRLREARATSAEQSRQFFTSNRRAADQVPALPEALFARARHHIVSVGRVLLLNCDAVTF